MAISLRAFAYYRRSSPVHTEAEAEVGSWLFSTNCLVSYESSLHSSIVFLYVYSRIQSIQLRCVPARIEDSRFNWLFIHSLSLWSCKSNMEELNILQVCSEDTRRLGKIHLTA
ncbi:Os07g0495700 [Oryza sativa Japonica Group]|uniref:Os07g0495700 protein n=1 Tax=Oryza sativa subsp. japonica TaxID=39947 RepID=Q8H4R6_ORYSJ|nr:hypothetical protein [Oryza sativa Japonica Group]BAD30404.1 hypothetical protein [Oryza sativa Japonica Group]BAF21611.2 Os07g0495700 [Oryza sativa Japonica Group]|eukprot:NP_001059697.2 Os07g0495700 [Oryza sativa Japonica Group]